jgi:RimJ/RimL family protein N-acetyltransferase
VEPLDHRGGRTSGGIPHSARLRGTRRGIYIKRILVADKERGTGQRALSRFLDAAFAREAVGFVWLIVRNGNARAQAVYSKLGFKPFAPTGAEAQRFDAVAEAPLDQCFRMLLRR